MKRFPAVLDDSPPMPYATTNDGVRLHYVTRGAESSTVAPILLVAHLDGRDGRVVMPGRLDMHAHLLPSLCQSVPRRIVRPHPKVHRRTNIAALQTFAAEDARRTMAVPVCACQYAHPDGGIYSPPT